jgi:DNA-binding transcriptional LysR family regulator
LPTIASLMEQSDMIAPLPVELVQPYLDSGRMVVLPYDLGLRMDLYGIITRKQHQLSPGAEAMLGAVRAVVTERYPASRAAQRQRALA